MTFYAFGLNYNSAPLDVVEANPLQEETQRVLYRELELSDRAEVIFVSTCNRKEAYLYGTEDDVQRIEEAIRSRPDCSWSPHHTFLRENEEAIRHVLQVTCGVRSMVTGDGQIFAQMKTAYQRAVDCGGIRSVMHRLMHVAFRSGKQVASETLLGSKAKSVARTAVTMMEESLFDRHDSNDIGDVRVLLVGAGTMGRLALAALQESAADSILVTNRSPETARDVAASYGGNAVPWQQRYRAVEDADAVFVATSASEPVLRASMLSSVPTAESDTLIVDIAVPRNVDRAVEALDGYSVSDLDDVKSWAERRDAEQESDVAQAEAICEEHLQEFVTWVFHQEAMQPAIESLRDTFDAIREREVERHAHRTGMNREEVDRLTKSIMQKLLAVPIVTLKNVDPDSIDFVQGVRLLQALFSRSSCEDERARSLETRSETDSPSLSDVPMSVSDLDENRRGEVLQDILRLAGDESLS